MGKHHENGFTSSSNRSNRKGKAMLTKRKPVPIRSPEEIVADAKQWYGNTEKVATTWHVIA
jgi:hypothetical protein